MVTSIVEVLLLRIRGKKHFVIAMMNLIAIVGCVIDNDQQTSQ